MKLTEGKLRSIIREELETLVREKSYPEGEEEGKVWVKNTHSRGGGNVYQVDKETAEENPDKYDVPSTQERSGAKLQPDDRKVRDESKIRPVVRDQIRKLTKERRVNELSFREDKMRELLTREPKLERIRQEEGHSLKTMFDMYVVRNKEMKRQYKQASPQPQ